MAITFNPLTRSLDNTVEGQTNLGTNTNFGDNVKLTFGASDDLQLYHDGSDSQIINNTNRTMFRSAEIHFNNVGNSENMAKFIADGAVELYYDAVKKLETASGGINVVGTVTDDGATHDGDVNFTGVSSYNAQWDKSDASLKLLDNAKIKIGTGADLQIYHTGSHSFIQDEGTGNLYIDANQLYLRNADTDNVLVQTTSAGVVQIKHNGTTKLETTSSGVTLSDGLLLDNATNVGRDVQWQPANDRLAFLDNTRATFGNSVDLQIYHDETNSIISNSTGRLELQGSEVRLVSSGGAENILKGFENGAVELYYDSVKTFETTSVGATLTGNLSMTAELNLLGGSDAARFIDSQVGDGNALHFRRITGGDAGHEDMAKFHGGGSCELYHDNVKKIETTSSGVTVTGSVTTQDMNMSNLNGSANEVDNTKGSWSLQEGANDLFLINRVNGKKYKFNLTEIN